MLGLPEWRVRYASFAAETELSRNAASNAASTDGRASSSDDAADTPEDDDGEIFSDASEFSDL